MYRNWIACWFSAIALVALAGCRTNTGLTGLGHSGESVDAIADQIDASLAESESAKQTATEALTDENARNDAVNSDAEDAMVTEAVSANESVQSEVAVVEKVVPASMSPVSPAMRIGADEIPRGYQARLDELQRIGTRLAEAAEGSELGFTFDMVYNPRRADTFHTEAGAILVTSSLLERLETTHQLAVAVAMEMATYLRESEHQQWVADQQSVIAAKGEGIVVNSQRLDECTMTPQQVQRTASELLVRAGFPSLDVASVKKDIDALVAAGPSRPRREGTGRGEPNWPGPSASQAN